VAKINESSIEEIYDSRHQIRRFLMHKSLSIVHVKIVVWIVCKDRSLKFYTFQVKKEVLPATVLSFENLFVSWRRLNQT
jgi:hypothetical protein